MSSYCREAPGHPWHGPYHDKFYGFPLRDDSALFARLIHEISQAGLSWLTILKRVEGYALAFDGFSLDKVAAYGDDDVRRLMADTRIIRNRRKIMATIENARRLCAIREAYGGFANWLDAHHPRSKDQWVSLFKKNFKFVGGEIVGEFLMSTGYLPGAHSPDCPVYERIRRLSPPWMMSRDQS